MAKCTGTVTFCGQPQTCWLTFVYILSGQVRSGQGLWGGGGVVRRPCPLQTPNPTHIGSCSALNSTGLYIVEDLRNFEGCTYTCVHVYTYTRIRIYVYTCPCAWVNAVSGPFLREGTFGPLPKYCLFASTTCRQCLQLAGRVYLWCTVSTDYTRVNVYVHSVYYTQCPPTIRIRIRRAYGAYTCTHVLVYAYTRVYVPRVYVHIWKLLPPLLPPIMCSHHAEKRNLVYWLTTTT